MIEKLIRRKEVESITGLSRSSIYAMIARGDFPKPIKIGVQAVAWQESAIQDWISSRVAASLPNPTCKAPVSR